MEVGWISGFIILVFFPFTQGVILETLTPIVSIANGHVQGVYKKTNDGLPFMQFTGIPYAKPPIGDLRFALPQPLDAWHGIWIANTSHICIQVDQVDPPSDGETKGTEDCLYLNVFVPDEFINPQRKLDVIVHIHGGVFNFGHGFGYSYPKPFMNREVIFVTLNYRLGIFGFLSTGDKHLPGNLGMKDQNFALRWIRDNIGFFGGNPESVTITGLSAGGASVHYHMLSPMSRGLFHKAISTSGNVLDTWTQQEAGLEKAKKLGDLLGCKYIDTETYINCLRRRPASQIVEATRKFRFWSYYPCSPFSVVVDDQADQPFLPKHPLTMLRNGEVADVPWMASLTTSEGLYPVAQLACNNDYFAQLRDNWDEYLSFILHYDYTLPDSLKAEVGQKIKKQYLGDQPVSKKTYPEIIQLASDRLFVTGMQKAIKLHSPSVKSPVYFYQYNYTTEKMCSFAELLFFYKEKYGVSHGDDTVLMFDQGRVGSLQDEKMGNFLIDMWLSFAKSGKPGLQKWAQLNKNRDEIINYLYIGTPNAEDMEMRRTDDLSNGNKHFWQGLPFDENENLIQESRSDL